MAKDKSHTVDWRGLNLQVSEINGATPGATVADGAITNAKVSASAGIARTKLAAHGVTAVSTADANDATTTQALVNELKAKINSLIAAV